jgi:hypothetical protein
MQYKLRAQLHEKYAWINDGVRGKKSIGSFQGTSTVGNNMNSPIRTSAIGLLQHLQLLYLPSELDIHEQIQPVTLPFYCMQYHPVILTLISS